MRGNFFKNRPAVISAFGLICGIVFSRMFPYVLPSWSLLMLPALLCLAVWVRGGLQILFVVASSVLLGAICYETYSHSILGTPLAKFAELRPTSTVVVGTIDEVATSKSGQTWILDVDSIGLSTEKRIAMSGRILLRYLSQDGSNNQFLCAGSYVKVYCSIEPYRDATNPHEFSVERKTQTDTRTEAQGEVRSKYDCYLLRRARPGILYHYEDLVNAVRSTVLTSLDSAIQDVETRGFVKAVVLGERSEMTPEVVSEFNTAGVSHILAVSGFNVAIVALVIAQVLRLIGIYWRRPRIIVTMVFVVLYCAIVGFQPSVVRAMLMIEILFLAQLLERKPNPLNILSAAVAINLLLRPSDLYDVGFQLSYGAVLGLILIAPELQRLFIRKPEATPSPELHIRIADALVLSVAATVASFPIIASHFYRISFAGLLTNMPVIPLSSIITTLGFLLIPVTAIYQPLGHLYGDATTLCTDLLLKITELASRLPTAAHSAAEPTVWFIFGYVIALIYICRAASRAHFIGRCSLVIGAWLLLAVLNAPFTQSTLSENKLQVLFFDVGQGDCIMIHTPAARDYFVDFGTVSRANIARADRVMLPFLRAENINTVEAGFISHMHRDHYGGAAAMLSQIGFASIYTSGERVADNLAKRLDSLTRVKHVSRNLLTRGDRLQLDSDVVLYVLHPNHRSVERLRANKGQNINSGSLAFKLVYRNTSVLFLGDVERSEEEEMRDAYGDFLNSTVVKVAHHGSLTSSSKEFVKVTHPKYAVISVGEHNRFGHPAPAIVKRWETAGAKVLRTDLDGALLFESDGRDIRRSAW